MVYNKPSGFSFNGDVHEILTFTEVEGIDNYLKRRRKGKTIFMLRGALKGHQCVVAGCILPLFPLTEPCIRLGHVVVTMLHRVIFFTAGV
jgi:hypothetical protein